MPKLSSDLLLAVLREAGDHPLGVQEILKRCGLHPGARTAVKRTLRELVRGRFITGEGKRYALRQRAARASGDPAASLVPAPARAAGVPALRQGRQVAKAPEAQPEVFHSSPEADEAESSSESAAPARSRVSADSLLKGFRATPAKRGQGKRLVGVLHLKSQGYGFVSPVATKSEDHFLPASEAQGLADGDLIEIEIVPRQGGRSSSRLIGLLERRRTFVVGRYEPKGQGAMVVPRDRELPSFPVEPSPELKEGAAVRLRLPEHAHGVATVEAVLGEDADPRLESLSVAYGKGFNDVFSDQALAEAAAYPEQVTEEQRRGRRDLRDLPLITIDGEDARDFDDAVYVEKVEGGTRLLVAIADVATYVRPGTALDVDALQRCTSVYFPDRVLPMLPERLSNGLCSLMPNVERLCLVADMVIDGSGNTRKTELYPAVMRSAARTTYTQVAAGLAGQPVDLPARVTERFPAMLALAETLAKMREQRGAIDFNLTEQKIVLGPDGKVADVVPRERNPAHRLIEAFMLAANEAVAAHFLRAKRPSIFRVHDRPDAEKLESFLTLARAHGFMAPMGEIPRPQALNAFLRKLDVGPGEKPKPEARALNSLMLRSMMQAVYAERNIGHYGLGAEGYLHFTSPIRRYPDLMVHRLLWAEWKGQAPANADDLGAVARRCSERERAAMSAEREIDSYYGALWARDHVGEQFAGTVDGAAEIGLFVEIDGHMVSGLVSIDNLGSGAELDPTTHRFTLGRTGATIGIGDAVQVEIVSANVARRQIDLALVGGPSPAPKRLLGDGLRSTKPAQGGRPSRPGQGGDKGYRGGGGPKGGGSGRDARGSTGDARGGSKGRSGSEPRAAGDGSRGGAPKGRSGGDARGGSASRGGGSARGGGSRGGARGSEGGPRGGEAKGGAGGGRGGGPRGGSGGGGRPKSRNNRGRRR